jgi:hypothetical protein
MYSLCVKFHNVIQWKIVFSLLCVTTETDKNRNQKTVINFLPPFLKWCSNSVASTKIKNPRCDGPWAISQSSQSGSVGTVTAYEGSEFESRLDQLFSLLHVVQTGSRALPASYTMGTGNSFSGGKAAGVWTWPFTYNKCRGQENAVLFIHSPIRLHGLVLN